MERPAFPYGLHASIDQAMGEFPHGKSKSNALKPIYRWLEIDDEDNEPRSCLTPARDNDK